MLRRMGRAHPAHVAFHEDLNGFTADAAAALQRFPNSAAGGHVRAKLHGQHGINLFISEKIPVNGSMRKSAGKHTRILQSRRDYVLQQPD